MATALWTERTADDGGVVVPRRVVQVAHRRLHVGVPHPLLHAPDVRLADHPRAEGVAQIVEAQRAQAGGAKCSAVPARQRRRVEVPAGETDEDELVKADETLPLAQSR